MRNKIEWTNRAAKQLLTIDRRYIKVIKEKVQLLADFPQVKLDIKYLDNNRYRLRHGDYRIFFDWTGDMPKIIKIQKIGRRKTNTYN